MTIEEFKKLINSDEKFETKFWIGADCVKYSQHGPSDDMTKCITVNGLWLFIHTITKTSFSCSVWVLDKKVRRTIKFSSIKFT